MPTFRTPPFASRSLTSTAQRLIGAIEQLKAGRGGLFVVTGANGSGKTELAEEITRHLSSGWTVAQSKSLSWHMHSDNRVITHLRRQIGGSDLRSMTDRANTSVVMIVDDAHWCDGASLRKLVEMVTSMTAGRLAVVLMAADGEDGVGEPSMSQLRALSHASLGLAPFTVDDIRAFGLSHAGIPLGPHTARSIQLISGGRPGRVREVLETVPREHWFEEHPTVPVPKVWLTSFDRRVTDPGIIPALRAAAVAPPFYYNPPDLVLHLLGGDTDVLEKAFDAGFLRRRTTNNDESIVFPNHTDRAVVLARMNPIQHNRLHRAAADFYREQGDESLALLFTARGLSGPDEDVAAALAARGDARGKEGRWGDAAENYFHAARVSPDPEVRNRRQLASIEALIAASNNPLARQYAEAFTGDAGTPAVDVVLGYLALQEGRRNEAIEYLDRAWLRLGDSEDGEDVLMRSRIASRHMLLSVAEWKPERIIHWFTEATRDLGAEDDAPHLVETYSMAQLGYAASATSPATSSQPTGIPLPLVRRHDMVNGWLAMITDDLAGARSLLGRPASSEGSERISTWIDAWLAQTHLLMGELSQALTVAERGLSRVENFHLQLLEPLLLRTCMHVCYLTGETARALEYQNRLTVSSEAFMVQRIPSAIARLEAAVYVNDPEATNRAGADLTALAAHHNFSQPGFWPWVDLWINHLIQSDRIDEAEPLLEAAEARVADSGIASLQARLMASRGRLLVQRGDLDGGIELFDAALAHISNASLPLLHAQLLYDYGRIIRRAGRRAHADALLAQAEERFASMNAGAFVEQSRRERRAGGVGVHTPQPDGVLTAQEQEIAMLVAGGATNQEAAQRLFLSAKTVEYHLTRVYRKLGIRKRAELATALAKI